MDTLEKEPLLTPYKKVGDTFSLEPKKSTLDDVAQAIGTDTLSDALYTDMRKDFRSDPLLYKDSSNGYELWANINEGAMSGLVKLASLNHAYTFILALAGDNDNSVNMEIRKDYVKFDAKDSDATANILWSNNMLNVAVDGGGQNLTVTGPLSYTNADLKFNFNGKDIGTIKSTKTDTHTEYDIQFNMDIPIPWKFSWKGTVDIEHGVFVIEKPTDSVEIETILPKKSPGFES